MSLATSDLHHHQGRLAATAKPIRKNKAADAMDNHHPHRSMDDDGSIMAPAAATAQHRHSKHHPDRSTIKPNVSAPTLVDDQDGRSVVGVVVNSDHPPSSSLSLSSSSQTKPSTAGIGGPCDKISTVKVANEPATKSLQRSSTTSSSSSSSNDSLPSTASTTMATTMASSFSNTNRVFLFDRSNFDHFQERSSANGHESFSVSLPPSAPNVTRIESETITKVTSANESSRSNRSETEAAAAAATTTGQPRNIMANINQLVSDDCCLLEGRKTGVRFEGSYTKKSSSSSISTTTSAASSMSAASAIPISSMDDDMPATAGQSDGNDETAKPLSRRQWYHLWLPSYKSRLNQFQRHFVGRVPASEKLVDDFVCAVHRELLLQGRMYVTVNNITFYSNIFGFETHICIRYKDISSISKASTVKVFPNAIQIITNSGLKYFFTSFVSRERAFRLMTRLWEYARREDTVPWPEIRKLIRESYTTASLGVDLSDIDDADVEIDLSKKSKKKKKKKKGGKENFKPAGINSSSELTNMDDLGDDDDHHRQDLRASMGTTNGCRLVASSPSLLLMHNVNVQTDNDDFPIRGQHHHHRHHNHGRHHHHHHHHGGHKCTLMGCFQQWAAELKNNLLEFVPSQTQVVRILFLLAVLLFVIQIGIYVRFASLNQRLLQTQQILFDTMMEQDRQPNWTVGTTTGGGRIPPVAAQTTTASGGFCFMKS